MPSTNIETPDWRRDMAMILEELNEGVVVVNDQLRVIFANEALTRMGTLRTQPSAVYRLPFRITHGNHPRFFRFPRTFQCLAVPRQPLKLLETLET
jgi:hypothetical protein